MYIFIDAKTYILDVFQHFFIIVSIIDLDF